MSSPAVYRGSGPGLAAMGEALPACYLYAFRKRADKFSMNNKRHSKRWDLILYLRVFDQETQNLIGHVVDITTEGMKVISDNRIPVGQVFNVWLDVPQEDGERKRISLQARSLWSERATNPDFYDTGFHLVNPTPEAVHSIRLVIDDLRFNF